MSNETFTEHKYAIYHKPTQTWVQFGNDDLELTVTIIELVDFKDCFINGNKDFMETFLKRSVFNKTPNYGSDNFLEFEFVIIKATYTTEL
jgi:hypothetical protein